MNNKIGKVKKMGFSLLLTGLMFLSLTGCGRRTNCDVCKKEMYCHLYRLTLYEDYTEDHWICDKCHDDIKSGAEAMGGTLEEIKETKDDKDTK